MHAQGRITVHDWDQYDTRHTVFPPALMSADALEQGYKRAYRDFYKWSSIVRGESAHGTVTASLRHMGCSAGWKTFEPCWDLISRAKRAGNMVLETLYRCSRLSSANSESRIRPTLRGIL
jgi:hypothetical protein